MPKRLLIFAGLATFSSHGVGVGLRPVTPCMAIPDDTLLVGRFAADPVTMKAYERRSIQAKSKGRARRIAAAKAVERHGLKLAYAGDGCFGQSECQLYSRFESLADRFTSADGFETAWGIARHLALQDIDHLNAIGYGGRAEAAGRLARDQFLRRASVDAHDLTGEPRAAYQLIASLLTSCVDKDNMEWARSVFAGARSSASVADDVMVSEPVWIMIVHARDDPAFRLQALSILKGAVERGRLSRAAYATREDHIISETTGWQRFGTKGRCVDGRFRIEPVANSRRLADRRSAAGLPTMREQAAIMQSACKP